MSGEAGVVVQRRDRAEIARVASLYRASGLGRSEFCRRHGMALSTLNRHLQKQFQEVDHPDNDGVRRSPLVEVKLARSVNPMRSVDRRCALTLLLSNGCRVEVDDGFNDETLRRMVSVLERF
jgi:hypothetical protein